MAKTASIHDGQGSGAASASVVLELDLPAGDSGQIMIDSIVFSVLGGATVGTYLVQLNNSTLTLTKNIAVFSTVANAWILPQQLSWAEGRGPVVRAVGGNSISLLVAKLSGTDAADVRVHVTYHMER